MNYANFAYYYDALVDDVDYNKWVNIIDSYLNKINYQPRTVLELACGTGNFTEIFDKKYGSVTGVDISEDMLMIANEKKVESSLHMTYLQQDMKSLALKKSYDTVFCLCDGLNYMVEDREFDATLEGVYKYLKEDGIFVFDLSTEYKLSKVLGNSTIAESFEEMSYIWENFYDDKSKLLTFDFTMFIKIEDETDTKLALYEKSVETHIQRAFSSSWIKSRLETKFEVLFVYDTLTGESLKEDSERVTFICRKRHKYGKE